MTFVRLGAVGHHRRPAHALANLKWLGQFAEDAFLLLPNHALDRRSATPAIFLWPVQAGPTALRLLILPRLSDFHHVVVLQADAAERGFRKLRLELFRRVGLDPFARGSAEFGFLRRVVEIHRRFLFLSFWGALKTRTMMCDRTSENLDQQFPDSGYEASPRPGMTIRTFPSSVSC